MVGSQLPWPVMKDLLTDAKALGVEVVRLYGGEPLLHPDLPRMIEYCTELRLGTYVTTNGILLKDKINVLYKAGLRDITIGFYGNGQQYDDYVQRRNSFERMEEGFEAVRDRYGLNVNIRMNWLLMRPTCNPESLSAAWDLAQRYNMKFQVDLIHYSLPYFSEGHDRELQFSAEDKPAINQIVKQLVVLKQHHPDVFSQSLNSIKSIPDWLIKGPDMRVPCDAYDMMWVGADGTVQLCYVTFKLGNLHDNRLKELAYTSEHNSAARGAFGLNCPNCHCHYGARIDKLIFPRFSDHVHNNTLD
jgi:MoaA/NifB/PqqE/SkfB family radical SAM enzyme